MAADDTGIAGDAEDLGEDLVQDVAMHVREP